MLLEKKSKIRLRDKTLEDAYQDYLWRCDRELAQLDGMAPLNIPLSEFLSCYQDDVINMPADQHRYAIETAEGKHIGNCMFYDLNEYRGEAEIGILIGDRQYWEQGYGEEALYSLFKILFANTSIQRIYLKTLADNIRAQLCFSKCGFVPSGRIIVNGNHFITMEISRTGWLKKQQNQP